MSAQLKAQANRFENWIKNEAIPLWLSRGVDAATGLSCERLLPNGNVDINSSLRTRVQARQAFFFAVAAQRGWCDEGAAIAQQMLSFVRRNARHPSGKGAYVHLLDKNHRIIDAKQDLYDHAFFLLAYAWVYRVTGDVSALTEAENIVAHLDSHFGSACGGWIEGDYAYACRRQNPHMHLFEAFLALYEASKNAKWLARAGEIFALFQSHFFDANQEVLFEFFQDDWRLYADGKGEIVEPGHMLEWVWLLDWYSRCSGRPVAQYTGVLYKKALTIGMDKSGLLFDAVAPDGRVIDANKRCWGQTELIKASLVQIRAGHPLAEVIAIKAVDDLFQYFLCATTPGSYIDQRGSRNEILVDFAPASTLYHLMVAATELIDYCNERS